MNRKGQILVVSQRGRSWSLPKGHIDPGEEVLAAAGREIYEESGLKDLILVRELGSYERARIGKDGGENVDEIKHLTFFLFRATSETLQPIDPDNPEARWVNPVDVPALLTHPADKAFVRDVVLPLL